jgi:hypothetical protein
MRNKRKSERANEQITTRELRRLLNKIAAQVRQIPLWKIRAFERDFREKK